MSVKKSERQPLPIDPADVEVDPAVTAALGRPRVNDLYERIARARRMTPGTTQEGGKGPKTKSSHFRYTRADRRIAGSVIRRGARFKKSNGSLLNRFRSPGS